jgi:hypothetical protein
MSTKNQDAIAALMALYDALDDAYWVASDVPTKDRIHGIAQAVYTELTRLNRLTIEERGKKYRPIGNDMKLVKVRLGVLKEEIDRVIHAIDTINRVVAAASRVLTLI